MGEKSTVESTKTRTEDWQEARPKPNKTVNLKGVQSY